MEAMANGSATTNAQRRAETRHELLRLGVERFPIKGYAATTIEDVVRESGLTRGAYYFHFDSKEDFFLEVLLARAAVRGPWWESARNPELHSIEEMLTVIFGHFGAVEDSAGEWLLLVVEFWQQARQFLAFVDRLRVLYDEWLGELRQFLSILQERGLARTDRDPAELSATVFAFVEGLRIHGHLYGTPPTGLIDAIVRLLRP